MKNKKILLILTFCLLAASISAGIWQSYTKIKPAAIKNDTTKVLTETYTDEQLAGKTLKANTASQEEKPTIEVPHILPPEQPLSPIPASQKQTTIRKTASKEYTYYPLSTANDPGYASNWAIQKVNAPAAWNISTGNGQTVVAVIDTGFALNHDDLRNNWFINLNESGTTKSGDRCWTGTAHDKSNNNCDDDNNGYIDDWRGWNFSVGDNNPMAGRTNPIGAGVAHGTQTSGLVGASGNNNLGITTINWNTKIMPLQALSDDGPGYTSNITAAIYYAVDNGADVINMSLGGSELDPDLKTATDYAYNHGVVVVAASGNCGTGTEQGCSGLPAGAMGYPALNDHVISVGATTVSDQRASFSSYGPDLDTVAPGSGTISSTTWTAGNSTSLYTSSLSGTSFASPQVASLASLIKSIRPDSTADDITALILATTTKLSAMNNAPYTNEYGHGVINANAALTVASSLNSMSSAPKLLQAGGAISEHRYSITDSLGSGCNITVNSYCSIWFRDDITGRERYLPYQKTNQQGLAGWSWNGALLPISNWQIRAVQGVYRSTPYPLGSK